MQKKLTKTAVEAIERPEKGERLVWDSELTGFGVRVTAGGKRSYIAQRRVNGKTRRVTIGRHGVYTADEARKLARTELGNMTQGTDPAATKARDKAMSVTLEQVVEAYLGDRDLKPRSRQDVRRHLDAALKRWKNRPVGGINRDKVVRRFRELSETAPTQANQAFRILRSVLNYARARYRTPDDQPILPDNPVQVISDARAWNRSRARNSYVPLDRIGSWWAAVQGRRADPGLTPASRTGADLVAFLALTGLRKGEATGLRWSDVDLDDASLRLEDTKNRESVTLPLSSQAVSLLSEREQSSDYVFPGRGGQGAVHDARPTLEKIAEATGITVTPHDVRRTFRAIAGAVGMELWKAKLLMHHRLSGDVTLGHYTDTEDVRYLRPEAQAIADYLDEQAAIAAAGNVASLSRRSA